jgi:flavin reductase (DIM6/NTAB) family NADH-FMN oxidoreductase RutF
MTQSTCDRLLTLDVSQPIWDRFFTVAPLVAIGTKEADGRYDLAPKHLAMPLGWDNYFGFACTPSHCTYQNIRREGEFTASFLHPDRIVELSLAAAPRDEVGHKLSLAALPTVPARAIDGVFLASSYLRLECQLDRIIDGFGINSLIVGKIIAAQLEEAALRQGDRDDAEILAQSPLLAYLSPGRFARIDSSFSFPFHAGFKR